MHITNCCNPQRIYNKYTGEFMYVPCGKCASCRNAKSMRWVQRLDIERSCWKYCVFFTLTYSEENVPIASVYGDYICDLSHKHQAPSEDCLNFNFKDDVLSKLSFDDRSKTLRFLERNDNNIRYLSVYDCQKFIKRLRKNLRNEVKRRFPDAVSSDAQVRYFLCGEYGSTTLRSHYHGLLFFNSEKEAACIIEVLHQAWQFGIVHAKFIEGCNSSYVAKYVNCLADLPPIYQHRKIRPFCIFSKSTPLGTLIYNAEEVRQLFFSCSPTQVVPNPKNHTFDDVRLWRTYQDKLYPKLSGFAQLTHNDRTALYRVFERYEQKDVVVSANGFFNYMSYLQKYRKFGWFNHMYDDYMNFLNKRANFDPVKFKDAIIRWYYISSRVVHQSRIFDISVKMYVSNIERFYDSCDKLKLKEFYDFQINYAKENSVSHLLGMDREYFETLSRCEPHLLTSEEISTLLGYGVDIDKFTNSDLSVRLPYLAELHPDNINETLVFKDDSEVLYRKFVKNKKKNDYLEAHPELKYKFNF